MTYFFDRKIGVTKSTRQAIAADDRALSGARFLFKQSPGNLSGSGGKWFNFCNTQRAVPYNCASAGNEVFYPFQCGGADVNRQIRRLHLIIKDVSCFRRRYLPVGLFECAEAIDVDHHKIQRKQNLGAVDLRVPQEILSERKKCQVDGSRTDLVSSCLQKSKRRRAPDEQDIESGQQIP